MSIIKTKDGTQIYYRRDLEIRTQAVAQFMRDSAQYSQTMEDLLSRHLQDIPRRHAEELTNGFAEFQAIVNTSVGNASQAFRATSEYLLDASQRWVLFVDALRQRGNTYLAHEAAGCPPVLAYDFEVIVEGSRSRIAQHISASGSRDDARRCMSTEIIVDKTRSKKWLQVRPGQLKCPQSSITDTLKQMIGCR